MPAIAGASKSENLAGPSAGLPVVLVPETLSQKVPR
jgi:hypothetical protein